MPKQLFDGQGNAVEAFTKEEVEEAAKANPELQTLQTKLVDAEKARDEATKKLSEFDGTDKGQNMANLRKAKETAEAEVLKLKDTVMGEIGGLKKKFDDVELEKTFIAISQGDLELAKKVQIEYESIVKPDDTEEAKRKKMGDAYKLAAGYSASPSIMGRVLGSAGAPAGGGQSNNTKPELVEFGKKFGLTEEDWKKHGRNQ